MADKALRESLDAFCKHHNVDRITWDAGERDGRQYVRWCFEISGHAEAFHQLFGGELIEPEDASSARDRLIAKGSMNRERPPQLAASFIWANVFGRRLFTIICHE
jgi:hypothetical protein